MHIALITLSALFLSLGLFLIGRGLVRFAQVDGATSATLASIRNALIVGGGLVVASAVSYSATLIESEPERATIPSSAAQAEPQAIRLDTIPGGPVGND